MPTKKPAKQPSRETPNPQPADKEGINPTNLKIDKLAEHKADATDEFMTTNHGTRINDDNNTLKAGNRGQTLLEDFIFREKMTNIDHERIPERIVHARG